MMKTRLFLATTTLLLIASSFPGAVSHEDDREATYIGASYLGHELNEECAEAWVESECFTRIPKGVVWVGCDGEGHPFLGDLYDGVGGVRFCEIPRGSTITLTMDDAAVEVPEASVTCYYDNHYTDDHGGSVTEWREFAYLEGSVTATVPDWCTPENGESSDVILFNTPAAVTMGTVYLEY